MDKKEPIPVRNIRIPDHLWYRLEALAQKRSVSRTTLLIEGIHLILATGEGEGSTLTSLLTQSVSVPAAPSNDLKRQLKTLTTEVETLKTHVDALEGRLKTLEELGTEQVQKTNVSVSNPDLGDAHRLGTEQVLNEDVPLMPSEPEDTHKLGTRQVQVADEPSSVDAPLTQGKLATRLSLSDKAVEKARRKGGDYFAKWSQSHDPDGMAWTWEGQGGRGTPLRYVPIK